jgi:peptidoglycan/LPS O-acetylase OafA/YrhL
VNPITSLELNAGSAALLCVAIIVGTACSRIPFYRGLLIRESESSRFHSIDGLRGFLAVGVMLHHIHLTHHFYQTGAWELTTSRVSTFLGRGSVAFFFMITAFLFWGRVIEKKGQIDPVRFYTSRVRRLVPMYLVSASLVILTALAFTHFRLGEPLKDLASHILAWITFTLPGGLPINGFQQTSLINTVFWSLVYEWKFYIALPILAALSRSKYRWLYLALLLAWLACFDESGVEWFFISGCAAAIVVRASFWDRFARTRVATVVVLACTAATMTYQPLVYSAAGAALLFLPFAIFAGGNTLFGILTNPAARALGAMSYSLYLLHNWVLYLAARLVSHFVPVASIPKPAYLLVGCGVVVVTVILSAATFRYIEHRIYFGTPER